MKKISLFLALVLPVLAFAGERSVSDAAALAAQFLNQQQASSPVRKASLSASAMQLAHTRQKLNSEAPAFYVFNRLDNGFVVVSGDDRTEDVLMYSDEGTLDVENANPNLKWWLNRLQKQISAANDENTYTAAEKKARKATMVTAISPLLVNKAGEEITWYQEEPYWNQCPMDLWKTSERCLTGCVATAAAQIMYKWRYPEKGTGSHSYTWKCCTNSSCTSTKSQTLSKDFSTVTFDWDNMLPAYDGVSSTLAQKNAVATLMYCCGVACEMGYGGETIGGSGAYTDMMGKGLVDYFGYTAERFITMASSSYYGESSFSPTSYDVKATKFEEYFNADLEAGRPIIMGGEDSDGGHEFVCDGRDTQGQFHINWGWEGDGNCYCKLTALKPEGKSGYDFSDNLDAMIGLQPAVIDTVHVTGVTVAPTTLTLKIKEKSTIVATVAPNDATVMKVTWSSNDKGIATVDANGKVTGVSQGSATITATTNDGGFKATCAVTVSADTIEITDCEKYSYEFTTACKTGSNTLGAYTWDITLDAASVGSIDKQNGRGQQFGDKSNPCQKVSLTTANTADCLVNSINVNAAMGRDGDGKLAVYIGGTQIGSSQSLTNTDKEYSFINTESVRGNLEIRLTNSKKALYVKAIEINPDGDVPVTGVSISRSTLSVNKGATATLTATVLPADATNQNVTWSSDKENIATVSATGVVTGVAAGNAVITVKTEEGNYTATCSVTVTESSGGAKTFALLSAVSDLKENMEVLIVNEEAQKAISTTQNSNNRAAADVTISNKQISLAAGQSTVEVFTLVKGEPANSWAFMTGDGQYIYAASSSYNYLKTQKSIDGNASFAISIASGVATMTAQGTNTRNTIMYNAGSGSAAPLFSCYASTSTSMKSVALYGFKSSTDVEEVKASGAKFQKLLIDGQFYILYDGRLYNAQGSVVK